ncbi:MAG: ROK family protein [Dehalococcoidia bacterium]
MALPRQPRGKLVCCIDIGGTKLLSALCDVDAKVLGRKLEETPEAGGIAPVLDAVAASIEELITWCGADRSSILGVGVAAAGPTDPNTGVVLQAPNLPGWQDVPVAQLLESRLGLPTYVDNDADLAALGEHVYGAGKNADPMIYITLSTGIGAGLIIGGEVYRGYDGSAGEIGHILLDPRGPRGRCGHRGCLESLASGVALADRAREALERGEVPEDSPLMKEKPDQISARSVFRAAQAGDPACIDILSRGSEYLGLALVIVANLLNPQMVVLGGGLSTQWDAYVVPALETMRRNLFPRSKAGPNVVPAKLGGDSSVLGCVAMVQRRSVSVGT